MKPQISNENVALSEKQPFFCNGLVFSARSIDELKAGGLYMICAKDAVGLFHASTAHK